MDRGQALLDGCKKEPESTITMMCSMDDANECGERALHSACLNGHLDVVRYLILEKNAKVVDNHDNVSMMLLHSACVGGQLKVVCFLLGEQDNETDVVMAPDVGDRISQERHHDGATALHWACHNGHLQVVKYLVEQCIDDGALVIHAKDNDGRKPIDTAKYCEYKNIAKYLQNWLRDKNQSRRGKRSAQDDNDEEEGDDDNDQEEFDDHDKESSNLTRHRHHHRR